MTYNMERKYPVVSVEKSESSSGDDTAFRLKWHWINALLKTTWITIIKQL